MDRQTVESRILTALAEQGQRGFWPGALMFADETGPYDATTAAPPPGVVTVGMLAAALREFPRNRDVRGCPEVVALVAPLLLAAIASTREHYGEDIFPPRPMPGMDHAAAAGARVALDALAASVRDHLAGCGQ